MAKPKVKAKTGKKAAPKTASASRKAGGKRQTASANKSKKAKNVSSRTSFDYEAINTLLRNINEAMATFIPLLKPAVEKMKGAYAQQSDSAEKIEKREEDASE